MSLDRKSVSVRLPLEVAFKIMRKFGKPEDASDSDAFLRAVRHSIEGEMLTEEDGVCIKAMKAENVARRQAGRDQRDVKNGKIKKSKGIKK